MALTKIIDGFATSEDVTRGTAVGKTMLLLNNASSNYTLTASRYLTTEPLTLAPGQSVQFFWDGNIWKKVTAANDAAADDEINIEDYGFSPSATAAVNKAAWATAIADAVALGKVLRIGPGTFDCNGAGSLSLGTLPVTGSVRIRGAGMNQTILRMTGYSSVDGAMMIQVRAGLFDVVIEDLTVQGPSASSILLDDEVCFGIWIGGGGSVTLNRVKTTMFVTSVKCSPEYPSYPGTGTKLYMNECYIKFREIGVYHGEGTDVDKDLFMPVNTIFEADTATLLTPGPNTPGSQYHATYINRGVSYIAIGCRYLKTDSYSTASGYSFMHYGGTGTARMALCMGCYFGPETEAAMLTSSTTHVSVVGCTFVTPNGEVAAHVLNDAQFVNCTFLGLSGAQYGVVDDQGEARVVFDNCYFGNYASTVGYTYGVRRLSGTTKEWIFNNCVFNGVDASGFGVRIDTGTVTFNSCDFPMAAGVNSVWLTGGKAIFRDCIMSGAKAIKVDNTTGAAVLELWRNRWLQSAKIAIGAASTSIKINGADNEFYESSDSGEGLSITTNTSVANLTGNLVCKRAIGTYAYASNKVTLGWNADAYSIDEGGGPTINTIIMKGSNTGGAADTDHNRYNASCVRLHVKQAFTLGNSGNIIAAGGARTVDTVVTLQYLPAQGKWYEV